MSYIRSQIMVCGGTGCHSNKSNILIDELRNELKLIGLDKEVSVIQTGCFGLCAAGPIVVVYPDEVFYSHVKPEVDLCQYFGHKKLNFFSLHNIDTERKIIKLQEPPLQPAVEFYNPVHCVSFCGYTKTQYIQRELFQPLQM